MSDIFGDWTRDVLSGTATADRIFGFSGRDRLSGLGGDDSLVGGRGDDSLYGGDGDDLLHGGTGSDSLRGGAGADTLVGGRGHDDLYGGAGADTFRFDDRDAGDFASGQADVIHDFGAHDILDLTRVDLLYDAFDAGPEPGRGSFSTWQVNGDTYVSWNTFGGLHDVVLKGYTGDVSSQIRWYQDDFSADGSTEGRVAAGESQAGVIEVSQDADWFKIDLTAGQVYTFDLKGDQGKGGLPDPYLTLYDADNLAFGLAGDDDSGGGSMRRSCSWPRNQGAISWRLPPPTVRSARIIFRSRPRPMSTTFPGIPGRRERSRRAKRFRARSAFPLTRTGSGSA